jgi:hypothetical protein
MLLPVLTAIATAAAGTQPELVLLYSCVLLKAADDNMEDCFAVTQHKSVDVIVAAVVAAL